VAHAPGEVVRFAEHEHQEAPAAFHTPIIAMLEVRAARFSCATSHRTLRAQSCPHPPLLLRLAGLIGAGVLQARPELPHSPDTDRPAVPSAAALLAFMQPPRGKPSAARAALFAAVAAAAVRASVALSPALQVPAVLSRLAAAVPGAETPKAGVRSPEFRSPAATPSGSLVFVPETQSSVEQQVPDMVVPESDADSGERLVVRPLAQAAAKKRSRKRR
jgi:hypothetical protein